MPFHFPFQALLHFRESLEHQHERRLRLANQQVAQLRRLVEQADLAIRQLQMEFSRELALKTSAAEMRFALEVESNLQEARRKLQLELSRMMQLRDQQQKVFEQVHRERLTLQTLRDEQLREYLRVQSRREQRALDELFLYRQHSPRNG